MAYGGLPFLGTACSVTHVCFIIKSEVIDVWYAVSTFIHVLRMFLHYKNRLDNIQQVSFISDLHTKLTVMSGVFHCWEKDTGQIDAIWN